MSGSAGGGGYAYQADAFAFACAFALTEQSLNWFDDAEDIPVALSMETAGPGDDLGLELRNGGEIEVQCKHGAKKDQRFMDAFIRAASGLNKDMSLRVVIMVDSSSSRTITTDLRSDVIRLGMGRTDNLKAITSEFLELLAENGIPSNASLFNRLKIVVKDFENGLDGQVAATSLLAGLLETPSQATTAWRILVNEGLELTAKRGRRDLRSLIGILGKHLTLSASTSNLITTSERYRQWVLKANESFWVPGLNIRMGIEEAWDELLLNEALVSSSESQTIAHQISRYHEWERLADNARRESETCRAEGAVIGKERLVITGGPSSGKSTLGRRLSVSLSLQGALVLRVSLQRVAHLLRNQVAFSTALLQVALDGSGIPDEIGRAVLSSPDYLIADGLDECDPDRTDVANHLISWATGHPDCHICVLTRPVGHTSSLLPDFNHAELLPLSDRAIESYSDKLISQKLNDRARAAQLFSEFKTLIGYGGEKRVASIAARNPLLLSFIICLFVEGKPLKEKRAELFEQIVDLIHHSSITDRQSRADIDKTLADRVIEVTAWKLINTSDANRKELLNELGRDLERQMGSPSLKARTVAELGLTFWEDRRLIERLTLGHIEAYTFVHLSLGEYLAGRYIAQMSDENLRNWIGLTRCHSRWRQPILMACGAGAAERVIPLLLELDEPTDPVSSEAVLAAFAIAESQPIDKQLVERVITRLRQRLTSTVPLVAIEAGESLRQIAPLAPEIINEITADLIEHDQQWTRLAGITARFATGKQYVTLDQAQKWLNDLRFVRRFHVRSEPAESRIEALPDSAYELQEYSALCALEKILSELAEPKPVVAAALERFRHGLSSGTVFRRLLPLLARHNAHDLAIKAFELDKPIRSLFDWLGQKESEATNRKPWEVALLEVIIAATQDNQSAKTAAHVSVEADDPSISTFTYLSILLSGLNLWETPYDHLQSIGDERQEDVAKEVFRGAIIALSLDPMRIAQEARLVIEKMPLTKHGLLPEMLRNIPCAPDWKRARHAQLNIKLIVDGLSHPSLTVVVAAANLLESGLGGDETRTLIRQALQNGNGMTIWAIAQIAPQLWGELETAQILIHRLKGVPCSGFEFIYKALAKLAASIDERLRTAILQACLTGLFSDRPETAIGAGEALLFLPLTDSPDVKVRLNAALLHWTERGSWCDRCNVAVRDGSCSNCRHIPPNPRSTLIKVLTRLGELDTEELLRFCEDPWHDVVDVAYDVLGERAAANPNVLKSLLTRIKNGLPTFDSSVGINLLYRLLRIPTETLSAVGPEILALTGSEVPAIRKVIISSLTAEWVPGETARRLAGEALNDASPAVRNGATKVLRLLQD